MTRPEMLPVKILLVEDSPSDAALLKESLKASGLGHFTLIHVERLGEAERALTDEFDVLLLDLSLPDCSGQETFLRARKFAPKLPIIVLTGQNDEDLGMEAVRQGVQDYLMKGQVDGRQVARAVRYAIERKHAEKEREHLIRDLQAALTELKVLAGLLPICANCKKIRDDQGYWDDVEAYIEKRSSARFSHGICPQCLKTLYPEFAHQLHVDSPPSSS